MILHEKGRAAATPHSDHPAKENLHNQDSTTSTQRMQERFSSNNGRVLRWINAQRPKNLTISFHLCGLCTL